MSKQNNGQSQSYRQTQREFMLAQTAYMEEMQKLLKQLRPVLDSAASTTFADNEQKYASAALNRSYATLNEAEAEVKRANAQKTQQEAALITEQVEALKAKNLRRQLRFEAAMDMVTAVEDFFKSVANVFNGFATWLSRPKVVQQGVPENLLPWIIAMAIQDYKEEQRHSDAKGQSLNETLDGLKEATRSRQASQRDLEKAMEELRQATIHRQADRSFNSPW